MTEADEIAESIMVNFLGKDVYMPKFASLPEATVWLKEIWPDWNDWVSVQLFDNIAESFYHESQKKHKYGLYVIKKD